VVASEKVRLEYPEIGNRPLSPEALEKVRVEFEVRTPVPCVVPDCVNERLVEPEMNTTEIRVPAVLKLREVEPEMKEIEWTSPVVLNVRVENPEIVPDPTRVPFCVKKRFAEDESTPAPLKTA